MLRRCTWVVGALLAGLAGCATSGGRFEGDQQRTLRDADPDVVLAEAAVILKREFGRLTVDEAGRRIETVPHEFTTARGSGTARDLYGGQSVMRRTARFRVGQRGAATIAALRIDIDRRDTTRQRIMHPRGHRLGDAPGHETPIDRDAATTYQQNTVWTRIGRDTRLERAILAELQDLFARRSADVMPAAAETTERPEPPEGRIEE